MTRYFEFEVTLVYAEPRVWRRFQLRAEGATFDDLHHAIQDACGWQESHLFQFMDPGGETIAAIPFEDLEKHDAETMDLIDYFPEHRTCRYLYDFGDGWEHDVSLVDDLELDDRFVRRLLGGERAFPLDDSGGIPGYEEMVTVYRGGPDPEDLKDWMGDWDPEDFNLELARLAFDR